MMRERDDGRELPSNKARGVEGGEFWVCVEDSRSQPSSRLATHSYGPGKECVGPA